MLKTIEVRIYKFRITDEETGEYRLFETVMNLDALIFMLQGDDGLSAKKVIEDALSQLFSNQAEQQSGLLEPKVIKGSKVHSDAGFHE